MLGKRRQAYSKLRKHKDTDGHERHVIQALRSYLPHQAGKAKLFTELVSMKHEVDEESDEESSPAISSDDDEEGEEDEDTTMQDTKEVTRLICGACPDKSYKSWSSLGCHIWTFHANIKPEGTSERINKKSGPRPKNKIQ